MSWIHDEERQTEASRPLAGLVLRILFLLALTAPSLALAEADLELTEDERAWLAEHPTIRVAPAPGFPPVEFFDEEGIYRGIAADQMALIEERLGIKFEVVRLDSWAEVLEGSKNREVDLWMEAGDTPKRREYMSFSRPWLHLPVVIIVRRDTPDIHGVDDLAGRKVAVPSGYATETYLKENYPELELVGASSIAECLQKVSFGSVDAAVANIATAGYDIEELGLVNLRVAGESGYAWDLCVGVRNDWPILSSILQKALDSTSGEERRAIRRKWIALEGDVGGTSPLLIVVAGLVGITLLALLVGRLRRRPSDDRPSVSYVEGGAWPVFLTAGVAIAVVVGATIWSDSIVRQRARQDTGNALMTVLNTTSQGVHDWLTVREDEVRSWSHRPGVQTSSVELLRARVQGGGSARVSRLTELLEPVLSSESYTGFLLLDREGAVIAGNAGGASLESGDPGLVDFVNRVLGSSRTTAARLPDRRDDGTDFPMLVGTTVTTGKAEIVGVLAFGLDPSSGFSTILQRGRIGESGETYAFNRSGRLISASRFEDALRDIELIRPGERGLLNVEIRDPEGNLLTGYRADTPRDQQPLTLMAESAVSGRSGSDLRGYNDYRGVPVIGMWVWDDELGLGIATEMDVDEAYAFLATYERQIWTGTLLAVLLILGLTALFLRHRVQMAQAAAELSSAYEIVKLHRDRMEEELNIGREIQMSMVPLTFPAFPDRDEFSVHATLQPAREVGGDFYDFFFVDDTRFCFCIGDVSGKGVPAALFMAVTQTLIKSRAADDHSPASILTHVNNELSRHNKESMFVTVFLGILDIPSGELTYTNAGHNPPYVSRSDASLLTLKERHGPVLGAVEDLTYGESTIKIHPNNVVLLYTDGVTEAFDNNGKLFSGKRLEDVLESGTISSAKSTVDLVVDSVHKFEAGAPQADDITVLGLQYFGIPDVTASTREKFVLKNTIEAIGQGIEEFDVFATEANVPVSVGRKVKTALDDILNNVVSYAFVDKEEHEIRVSLELAGRSLTVTVHDDGIPFNPLANRKPDTDQPLEAREIGGLGIHLVRNLADEVTYRRHIDSNVLTMVFRVDV